MTEEIISMEQEEADALRRIAASRDGALLHRYLRRVLEEVFHVESDGALRAHHGRRTLARDLMTLMRDGIDVHRTDSSDSPILARSGGAVAVTGRSHRRDPSRFPRVDSYSDDLNPDGSEPGADKA